MAAKKTNCVVKTLLATDIRDVAPGAGPVIQELYCPGPIPRDQWKSIASMLPSHGGGLPVIVHVHLTPEGHLFLGPVEALPWLDRMRQESDGKYTVTARVYSGLSFADEARIASETAALHFAYEQSRTRRNPAMSGAHTMACKLAGVVGVLVEHTNWQPTSAEIATRFNLSATTVRAAVPRLFEMKLRNSLWLVLGRVAELLMVQTAAGKALLLNQRQSARSASLQDDSRAPGTSDARIPNATPGAPVSATHVPPALPTSSPASRPAPLDGATPSVPVPTPEEGTVKEPDEAEQQAHADGRGGAAQAEHGHGNTTVDDAPAHVSAVQGAPDGEGRIETLAREAADVPPASGEDSPSTATTDDPRREHSTHDQGEQPAPQVRAPQESPTVDTQRANPPAATAQTPVDAPSLHAALPPSGRQQEEEAASTDAASPTDIASPPVQDVIACCDTHDNEDGSNNPAVKGARADYASPSALPMAGGFEDAASSPTPHGPPETTACETQGAIVSSETVQAEGAAPGSALDSSQTEGGASVDSSNAAPAEHSTHDEGEQLAPQVRAPQASPPVDPQRPNSPGATTQTPAAAPSPHAALPPSALHPEEEAASTVTASPTDLASPPAQDVIARSDTQDSEDGSNDPAVKGARADHPSPSTLPMAGGLTDAASSPTPSGPPEPMACEAPGAIGSGETVQATGTAHGSASDSGDTKFGASVVSSNAAPAADHTGHSHPAPATPATLETDGAPDSGAVASGAAVRPWEPGREPEQTHPHEIAVAPPTMPNAATTPDGPAFATGVPARTDEPTLGIGTPPLASDTPTAAPVPAACIVALTEAP